MQPALLKKIDLFFSHYPVKVYRKGQILILVGDIVDSIYYLQKGRVKVYDVSYRGDEIILNTHSGPTFFPMSLAFNHTTSPYIYEAETDIEVRLVPKEEISTFLQAHPKTTLSLLSHSYNEVDAAMSKMSYLMGSSAKTRLVYEIICECRKFGELQADGSYVLSNNERGIGARAGLSRETVSREAKSLKQKKLLSIKHNSIIVQDIKKLEEHLQTHA